MKHDKYDESQTPNGFHTSETQFPNPEGVKLFTGYGADESDLVRGFCQSSVEERPEYDKANYHDRYSDPKLPDIDQGNRMWMSKDMEFRTKERESKGFLTRPRIPTER